jgi:hypothetical protein
MFVSELDILKHHPLLVDALLHVLNASSIEPSPYGLDSILVGSKEVVDLLLSIVLAVSRRCWIGAMTQFSF